MREEICFRFRVTIDHGTASGGSGEPLIFKGQTCMRYSCHVFCVNEKSAFDEWSVDAGSAVKRRYFSTDTWQVIKIFCVKRRFWHQFHQHPLFVLFSVQRCSYTLPRGMRRYPVYVVCTKQTGPEKGLLIREGKKFYNTQLLLASLRYYLLWLMPIPYYRAH